MTSECDELLPKAPKSFWAKNSKIVLIPTVCVFVALVWLWFLCQEKTEYLQKETLMLTKSNEKYVYLIRHGEKYSDEDFGLSLDGLEHALCLYWYFQDFPLGAPQIAFAESSKEERAIQTLLPTSLFLDIPFNFRWDKDQIDEFIKDIYRATLKYDHIVVAYEHHYVPTIAQRLGCTKCHGWNTNPFNPQSEGEVYNLTWVFSLTHFETLFVYSQNYFPNRTCQFQNITYEVESF